jgi:predicted transcriptional regulator
MDSLTIRVSRSTHELLRDLAARSNVTMASLLDEAVRDLKRKRFWADYHASVTALKADPQAWADLQSEVAAWDNTLADGLEEPSDVEANRRGQPAAR